MIKKLIIFVLPLLTIFAIAATPLTSVSAASCPLTHCKKFTYNKKDYYVATSCKKNDKGNYKYSYYKKDKKTKVSSPSDKLKNAAKSARKTLKSKCDSASNTTPTPSTGGNTPTGSSGGSGQSYNYNASVCDEDVPDSVKQAAGCDSSDDPLGNVLVNILNTIIGISSLVAVIFIVVGGVQYITSAGDSSKTQKAKNTILYACIGLAVCALAFAIVNFAVRIINGA